MTYRSSVGMAFALRLLLAGALSTFCLDATARAQQNIDWQSAANAYYAAYSQAHTNTVNAAYQQVSQEQLNALIYAEIVAWNAYVQAQNAANAQARVLTLYQQIANIDATVQNWSIYVRNLYNFRNAAAYANDPSYRARYDNWVNGETARANNYVGSLQTVRGQIQAQINQGQTTTVVSQPIDTPQAPTADPCDPSYPYPSWCGIERTPR